MEDNDSKAGELERRRSTRESVMVSVDNGVEEDELALEGTVADGFRPTHISGTRPPSAPPTPPLTSPSSTTLFSGEGSASPATTSRSLSTVKPPVPQFALSVQKDANALSRQATNSTGSSFHIPHDSPYRGPSGASHPYHMYTQNVRPARTLSMATSSIMPLSESSYRGPMGPSHPYGLYPQNDDGVEVDAVRTVAIPLGFRGLPDQYQRRVGPEGEEAGDMIGPDGHTEQLPPYTRYPEEAYVRKAAAVEGSSGLVHGVTVVPPAHSAPESTVPPLDGAGGIGLATRNPEFESTDDLDSPRSQRSARSFTSDDSRQGIRVDGEGVSEKRQPPKKWQTLMRKKACGIVPYWAICLSAIVLLVMLVVLGAVVGTVLNSNNKQKRPPPWKKGDWTTPSDVTPIPTPTNLQPLATGAFGLPLMTNRISNTCLKDPTLSKAWSCYLILSGLTLNVTKEEDNYQASLDCNHAYTARSNVYAYGEQPPLVEEPVTLELVQDKYEPSRGPAWFKMLKYNKTVILPEGWLVSSQESNTWKRARRPATLRESVPDFKRKGIAQPGDKPWICNWPDTWLELFIYAQQNSSFANWPLKPPSSSSTTTNSSTLPPPTPSPATSTDESDESDSSLETGSYPLNGDHRTGGPEPWKKPYDSPQNHARSDDPTPTTPLTDTSTTAAAEISSTLSTATASNPFGPIDTGSGFPDIPRPYPHVIKLEERRISTKDAPRAQCTQVEILGFGEKARPVKDPDGRLIVVDIEELGPFIGPPLDEDLSAEFADGVRERSTWERDQGEWDGGVSDGGVFGRDVLPDISPCGCMWFLT
ncbi:hypothetical protein P885DRAFT_33663 [Corynascus similis CBS 632.67]